MNQLKTRKLFEKLKNSSSSADLIFTNQPNLAGKANQTW